MTHPDNPALSGKGWPFPEWLPGAKRTGAQPVTYLGQESQWFVARTHVHPRLFLAQAMTRWAEDTSEFDAVEMFGLNDDGPDSPLEDWAAMVQHRWAVADVRDGAEIIRWENLETGAPVSADEPSAFPITLLDTEV